MAADDELVRLLQAVRRRRLRQRARRQRDARRGVTDALGSVAEWLQEAKARSFIWGTARRPAAGAVFTDLEVTVQGQRFLSAHARRQA